MSFAVSSRSSLKPWLLALGAVVLAFGLRLALEPWLNGQLPFITTFFAVGFAVWRSGMAAATVAALVGYGLSIWFIAGVRDLAGFQEPRVLLATLTYVAACTGMIGLGGGLRRARRHLLEEVAVRRRAEQALQLKQEELYRLNATLEGQVAERTAALAQSEMRLRTVFGSSYQYQAFLALDGTLLDANTTSLASIGASLDDVAGQFFWEAPWFANTPGLPERLRELIGVAATGRALREEIVVVLPQGPRVFDLSLRPVADAQGRVVAIVPEGIDITERREAEERLRQAQKIEAIGQLSGGVAHDFNNLLMVISGGLELLTRVKDSSRHPKIISGMRQAVRRGAGLSRQLLAFSRRQALAPRPIDLQHYIAGMRELLDRSLRGDVKVRMAFASDLWPIEVDPGEFELVVLNLAVNSRDAMQGSGTILIQAENLPSWTEGELAGDFVRLSVIDSGSGMPPEVQARAFEPFFTTKPVGKGSGLGLAQAHGFARASGGSIRIDSAPGEGTTVSIYLPRTLKTPEPHDADEAAPPAEAMEPAAGAPAAARRRLLLVEDDDAVASLTAEMGMQLGFAVTRMPDADAALKAFPVDDDGLSEGHGFDAVISDVMMPGGLDGLGLAAELSRRAPGLPVLLMSGHVQAAMAGAQAQGVPLLAKPFDLAELERGLAQARVATLEAQALPSDAPSDTRA